MARYRPCPECGLTALPIDPWVWRHGGLLTAYFDLECPAGHITPGFSDHPEAT